MFPLLFAIIIFAQEDTAINVFIQIVCQNVNDDILYCNWKYNVGIHKLKVTSGLVMYTLTLELE